MHAESAERVVESVSERRKSRVGCVNGVGDKNSMTGVNERGG